MAGQDSADTRPETGPDAFPRRFRRARMIGFAAGAVALIALIGGWAVLTRSGPPFLVGLLGLALPIVFTVLASQSVNNRCRVPCPDCGGDCFASFQRQVQDSGYYRFTCTECGLPYRDGCKL